MENKINVTIFVCNIEYFLKIRVRSVINITIKHVY